MGTLYVKGMSIRHVSTSRSSIIYKSPVAALKIARALKRSIRHADIVEAWNEVRTIAKAA